MTTHIKQCTHEDIHKLQEISYETFKETFGNQNSIENMNAYLERAFNLNQLEKEFANSSSEFFCLFQE